MLADEEKPFFLAEISRNRLAKVLYISCALIILTLYLLNVQSKE